MGGMVTTTKAMLESPAKIGSRLLKCVLLIIRKETEVRKTIIRAAVAAAMLSAVNLALGQTTPDPHQHDQTTPAANAAGAADPMMQMMSGMMGMMQIMHGQGGMGQGMGMAGMGPADRVEGRIAFLRAELKITGAQEKVWNRVADALRANAERMKKAGQASMPMQTPSGGVVAALEADKARLKARLDALDELEGTLKPLYGVLSDEQKKTADELLPSLTGMMGPGMMGGMGSAPMMQMMGQGMPGVKAGDGSSPTP